MLGANHSLYVFGVDFQLYGQLKKSLHNGTGVLGSTAVSIVSQATRLGKDSSVTMQDEHVSWGSYYSKIDLEWILKKPYYNFFQLFKFFSHFSFFKLSLFI